eukprot:SAG11_NODE_850_length_6868_cov_3.543523_4_plen_102_part_00
MPEVGPSCTAAADACARIAAAVQARRSARAGAARALAGGRDFLVRRRRAGRQAAHSAWRRPHMRWLNRGALPWRLPVSERWRHIRALVCESWLSGAFRFVV